MPRDTAPIRAEEQFDEERVADHLRHHLPDLLDDRPIEFAQFPGGKANLTYLVRQGDLELTLRRPPLGPTAPGSHDMAREYRVLSRLNQSFPKAPLAFYLCEDEDVMGKPFFVMERRRGFVVRETWPDELPDTDAYRRELAEEVVDTLVDLHLVSLEAVGLTDLGKPAGFVERQVAGWTKRWELAKHEDLPEMTELGRRLAARVPLPQRATLLHNDYKLDNLMVDASARVVAVFDWDMATTGDPLVDLGTALAYWAEPSDATYPILGGQPRTLSATMSRAEVADRYAAGTELDLDDLAYYEALALFRITVIIQQIYIRYLRGQTSDERFAGLGQIVPPLAEAGLATIATLPNQG